MTHPSMGIAERVGDQAGGGVLVSALEQAEMLCEQWPVRPGPPNISQRRTPSTATCALRPEVASVGTAREFARVTLADWRIGNLSDDVSLVVSELVTNALRHALAVDLDEWPRARSDETLNAGRGKPPPWVQLSLLGTGHQLLCAVRDPSDHPPVRMLPDYIAQTGRGLHLVDSFSLAWGWVPLHPAGKVVWALFPSPY
jgi:hypothetical protein